MARETVVEIAMTYLPDIGGGETHLRDLIEYISRFYKTVVITMKPYQANRGNPPIVERTKMITVIRLPRPLRYLAFRDSEWRPSAALIYMPLFFSYITLWSVVKGKEVKSFHMHGLLLTPLCAFLKILTGKRCIISVHFTFRGGDGILYKVLRWSLTKADYVLVLSNLEKENMIKFGIPKEKVKRFTYWVDLNTFKPIDKNAAREKLRINRSSFVVLFVGRLIEEKGVKLLFEVAKNIKEFEFYIVGDGPLRGDVKRFAEENDNFHFVGPVNNQSLPLWYNASDVLVVPSISEEGFGRVIIEALACGVPVLGSNLGGIPEAIKSDMGIIVDPNPQDITRALREIANSQYDRFKIRKYAEEQFGLKNAEEIMQLIS